MPAISRNWFEPDCRRCPRLAAFLDEVKARYPDYHARPVAPFGSHNARLLVVGLAPGLHGANRSGRPFTGDHAGILLYQTLHKHGFSNGPKSVSREDGLRLKDCRITNAVKCLPPRNKPESREIRQCNHFLAAELGSLPKNGVVIALGGVAHNAVLRAEGLKLSASKFGHGREYALPGNRLLLDSYHCSRYNTQTRRLTSAMFDAVFQRASELLAS